MHFVFFKDFQLNFDLEWIFNYTQTKAQENYFKDYFKFFFSHFHMYIFSHFSKRLCCKYLQSCSHYDGK